MGIGNASGFGSRNVNAVYAELYAPLRKDLEVTAAARFDDYSDIGGTLNPKVGIKWNVLPSLVLRGTWASGFRAPGLYETSTANATDLVGSGADLNCRADHDAPHLLAQ